MNTLFRFFSKLIQNHKLFQSSILFNTFPSKHGDIQKQAKVTAVSRETQECTRNSQSHNTFVPGITEEYITQVSEEIEGRVIEKLSQESNWTKSRILAALSKLDEYLLNPQVRTLSGTVPWTSRNNDLENREPTGDRFQSGYLPEVEFFACRTGNSIDSDLEDTSHCILEVLAL